MTAVESFFFQGRPIFVTDVPTRELGHGLLRNTGRFIRFPGTLWAELVSATGSTWPVSWGY